MKLMTIIFTLLSFSTAINAIEFTPIASLFLQDKDDKVYTFTKVNSMGIVTRTVITIAGTWTTELSTDENGKITAMIESFNHNVIRECYEDKQIKEDHVMLNCEDSSLVEIYFSQEDSKLVYMMTFYENKTISSVKTVLFGDFEKIESDYKLVKTD